MSQPDPGTARWTDPDSTVFQAVVAADGELFCLFPDRCRPAAKKVGAAARPPQVQGRYRGKAVLKRRPSGNSVKRQGPAACAAGPCRGPGAGRGRSEEHTSELQSLMRISYAVFCLKQKIKVFSNIETHRHITGNYKK